MPVTPTYPGVYIEELPSSTHTITAAPTSVTVFIGYTHPFKTPLGELRQRRRDLLVQRLRARVRRPLLGRLACRRRGSRGRRVLPQRRLRRLRGRAGARVERLRRRPGAAGRAALARDSGKRRRHRDRLHRPRARRRRHPADGLGHQSARVDVRGANRYGRRRRRVRTPDRDVQGCVAGRRRRGTRDGDRHRREPGLEPRHGLAPRRPGGRLPRRMADDPGPDAA